MVARFGVSMPDLHHRRVFGAGEARVVIEIVGDPEQVDAARRAAIVAIAKVKAEIERGEPRKPCGCGS